MPRGHIKLLLFGEIIRRTHAGIEASNSPSNCFPIYFRAAQCRSHDKMRLPQPSQDSAQQRHTRRPPVIPRHRPTPPLLGFVPLSLSCILGAPETSPDRPMPKRPAILPPTLAPRGLSRTEAAAYIGVSPTLFDHLVRDRRMPPPKRINARTVWDRKKLDRAFELIPDGDHSDHNPWDD